MARVRIYPHRTANADDVGWGGWWIERGVRRSPLGPLLEHWDYAREEKIGINVKVDVAAILRNTGIASIREIDLMVLVDCPATQTRFTRKRSLVDYAHDSTFEVSVVIPPGEVADEITLSAHLT